MINIKVRLLAVFSILFVASFLFPPLIPKALANDFSDNNRIFKTDYIECQVFGTNCNNMFSVPLNVHIKAAEIDLVNNSGDSYAVRGVSLFLRHSCYTNEYGYPSCTYVPLGSSSESLTSVGVGSTTFHFSGLSYDTTTLGGDIVASIYAFSPPANIKMRIILYGNTLP